MQFLQDFKYELMNCLWIGSSVMSPASGANLWPQGQKLPMSGVHYGQEQSRSGHSW